jgi:hypothetical protein
MGTFVGCGIAVGLGITCSLDLQSWCSPILTLTFTGTLRLLWYSSWDRHNLFFSFTFTFNGTLCWLWYSVRAGTGVNIGGVG